MHIIDACIEYLCALKFKRRSTSTVRRVINRACISRILNTPHFISRKSPDKMQLYQKNVSHRRHACYVYSVSHLVFFWCALRSFSFYSAEFVIDQRIPPNYYILALSLFLIISSAIVQLSHFPAINTRHSETANEHKVDPRDLSVTMYLPFLQGFLRRSVNRSLNKFIQPRCFLLSRYYPPQSISGRASMSGPWYWYLYGEVLKCHANKRSVCPKFKICAYMRNRNESRETIMDN